LQENNRSGSQPQELQNRANFSEKVDNNFSALANNNAIKKLKQYLTEETAPTARALCLATLCV
jgi:hypothetical protein